MPDSTGPGTISTGQGSKEGSSSLSAAEADMGQGFQDGWIERRRKSLTLPLQP